ncbi:GntR family transcriptional regulator [Robbsia sp. Bb-Pol-6]|uniref:GntR family transcriptional regulator n=1 Tax=Robbsia betulipollinis TaxID=2981849 RepID=A0ABT3ZJ56_9BURK|nr:GntR family transcriptional regulator [Robbsia betulipollinis]MCY0386000.1 GntR family transcriptional regulator [Robbsia betulipollinis]
MSDIARLGIQQPARASRSANNLAAQIYAQLKADIFDFRLLPGDRFSEGDIAARMQVSRTPVRQALFWLQREGYVDVNFRSGWQVREFDFKFFEDLYEVRVMMETSAIRRIVADGLSPRLDAVRAIWSAPPHACAADADADDARAGRTHRVAALDEAFHASLIAAVGNNEMMRIHQEVTERIRIIRRLDFTKPLRIDATYREHAAILDAIGHDDAATAQALICEHIARSQAEVKRITLYTLQMARDRYADAKGDQNRHD